MRSFKHFYLASLFFVGLFGRAQSELSIQFPQEEGFRVFINGKPIPPHPSTCISIQSLDSMMVSIGIEGKYGGGMKKFNFKQGKRSYVLMALEDHSYKLRYREGVSICASPLPLALSDYPPKQSKVDEVAHQHTAPPSNISLDSTLEVASSLSYEFERLSLFQEYFSKEESISIDDMSTALALFKHDFTKWQLLEPFAKKIDLDANNLSFLQTWFTSDVYIDKFKKLIQEP